MTDHRSTALSSQCDRERLFLFLSLALVVVMPAIFYSTASSMFHTWVMSETYTHGFLILPISIWLFWQRRSVLARMTPAPNFYVLILLLCAGVTWLLADLVDVLVAQQLAFVAILVLSFWTVMGNRITARVLFPLGFLFFAVPMGESLIPPMREYTATVLVALVKLVGIPVYRDGMFISLPSGNWSVVEACSGVRYIIASVTLGSLFAYLSYNSIGKRLTFIVISVLVPIVANGLRAFMIVMLGHFSDMTIAVGVDHLIYGWLFFGLVMFILFSIGLKWRDPETANSEKDDVGDESSPLVVASFGRIASAVISVLGVVAIWPLMSFALNQQPTVVSEEPLLVPASFQSWQTDSRSHWDWKPKTQGEDRLLVQTYLSADDERYVGLYLAQYIVQRQGKEVANVQNRLDPREFRHWRIAGQTTKEVAISSQLIQITELVLKGPTQELLVWHWYRVGDYYAKDKYSAKFSEAKARLFDGRRDAAIITIATPINGSRDLDQEIEAAGQSLASFLAESLSALEYALDKTAGNSR